jgi:PIN domain nuclease of toxin-antitoxin system
MIAEAVVDTSAVIAVLREEAGCETVRAIGQAWISAVNYAELAHIVARFGYNPEVMDAAPLNILPFDQASAIDVSQMLNRTQGLGLSLGDCTCLAMAKRLGLPAVTADRRWAELDLGVEVVLIR